MSVIENPDFLHLPAPVAALFARAAERSFFALPIWYHVLSRYGTDKDSRPLLYLDDAAALACVRMPESRRLAGLSNYYSTEHSPIYAAGDPRLGEALIRIADSIAHDTPPWHSLQIAGLDPADPSFDGLRTAFARAGWAAFPFFDSGTWYEDTRGLDFARYLADRPAALRNTSRRRSNKLDTSHNVEFRFHEGVNGIDEAIADYETVYRASWKGSEPFPEFTPHLIRAAAEAGALRLGLLYLDGAPAAAQFWIVWRGRATIYKLAHDSRFDDLSIGTVLTIRMVERVLAGDQPSEIDFGRGDDPYKKQWLTKRRERWGILVANPRTLPGLVLTLRERAASTWHHWRRAGKIV